jgi:AraC family transcriptional regulator of adaptative response / DNA-3-methyladenine glycosylase II
MIARRPGVRIPGYFDGFDGALRAILRGHVFQGREKNKSATLPDRVAQALGKPITTGVASLSRLAPTAAEVAEAGASTLEELGVPARRASAAIAVARLVLDRKLQLGPGGDPGETRRLLTGVGVGDRLAHLIVMRALSWPDTLPAGEAPLQRAAGVSTVSALETRAEQWRPWRTYASLHLWLEGRRRA